MSSYIDEDGNIITPHVDDGLGVQNNGSSLRTYCTDLTDMDKDKAPKDLDRFTICYAAYGDENRWGDGYEPLGAFFVCEQTGQVTVSNGEHIAFNIAESPLKLCQMFGAYKIAVEEQSVFYEQTKVGFVEALLGFADVSPHFTDEASIIWRGIYPIQQCVFKLTDLSSVDIDKDI
jgi:hypothetical protein